MQDVGVGYWLKSNLSILNIVVVWTLDLMGVRPQG